MNIKSTMNIKEQQLFTSFQHKVHTSLPEFSIIYQLYGYHYAIYTIRPVCMSNRNNFNNFLRFYIGNMSPLLSMV